MEMETKMQMQAPNSIICFKLNKYFHFELCGRNHLSKQLHDRALQWSVIGKNSYFHEKALHLFRWIWFLSMSERDTKQIKDFLMNI